LSIFRRAMPRIGFSMKWRNGSGVTHLVETDEVSETNANLSVAVLQDIDNHLKIMIKQIHKNNQVMAHMLKQQIKPAGDNPAQKK